MAKFQWLLVPATLSPGPGQVLGKLCQGQRADKRRLAAEEDWEWRASQTFPNVANPRLKVTTYFLYFTSQNFWLREHPVYPVYTSVSLLSKYHKAPRKAQMKG